MKVLLSVTAAAAALATSAQAALVEIRFSGASTSAAAADPARNSYGADVSDIRGSLIFDTDATGVVFPLSGSNTGKNFSAAITSFMIDTGVPGVGNGELSIDFQRDAGFGLVSVRNFAGSDIVTFQTGTFSTGLIDGEGPNIAGISFTLTLSGPSSTLSSDDLDIFDATAFSTTRISMFAQRNTNDGKTVSVLYNFGDISIEEVAPVPVPGAALMLGTALAGFAGRRRFFR